MIQVSLIMLLVCFMFHILQTLRRLAQNREAARKSRLRKKVGLLMICFYLAVDIILTVMLHYVR